jgi:hypothetical protein
MGPRLRAVVPCWREEPEQGCVVDVGIWRELFLSPSFVRASFLSLLVITEPNWG